MVATSYLWFPVTGMPPAGSQIGAGTTLSWIPSANNWYSGSDWAQTSQFSFTGAAPSTGTVPGTVPAGIPGTGDDAGLVAGAISASDLAFYNIFAPGRNDPTIESNSLPVYVAINTGTIYLNNLLLAGFGIDTPALHPTLDVEGATLFISGNILNTESVTLPSGLGSTAATGGGTIDVGSGGLVEANGTVQADIDFNFMDSSNDVVKLDNINTGNIGASFSGTITDFGDGDTIWLPTIPLISNGVTTTATYDAGNGQVDLVVGGSGGSTINITIDLTGPSLTSASSVLVKHDTTSGIDLVTCFAAGTRIATPRGEVAVEDLRAGDLVETELGGTTEPVIWVGRRHLECRRHPTPQHAWPIRISAGAFGPGRPYRDLLVSPDHAIYANDVLIPAKRLVNGTTIQQIAVDAIDYYHVELSRHDVLLANGLAVESYLDVNDNRGFFANGGGPVVLYPDLTALAWEANGCAPLVVTGPELEAARAVVERFAAVQAAA